MAKKQKIKRYYRDGKGVYKARPHPLFVLLMIVLAVGLVFVGLSIYEPVSEFILNRGSGEKEISSQAPNPSSSLEGEEGSVGEEPSEPDTSEPAGSDWKAPEKIHALELPLETAQNPAELAAWLDAMPEPINAAMVRVKNADGMVRYQSRVPSVAQWGAQAENALDLEALSQTLRSRDVSLVVWMSAFSDPMAARGDRENIALTHVSNPGMLWLDNAADMGGQPWANPYSAEARTYLCELIGEVSAMGADLIILDHMYFPNDPTGGANYGDTGGISRNQVLSGFLKEAEAAANGREIIPYVPQQIAGDAMSALGDTQSFGGKATYVTNGRLMIRLGTVAGNAGIVLEDVPEDVRSRLVLLLEGGAPSEAAAGVLENEKITTYVCIL